MTTTITIAGQTLDLTPSHVSISSSYNEHHSFMIHIPLSTEEELELQHFKFLGKDIKISYRNKETPVWLQRRMQATKAIGAVLSEGSGEFHGYVDELVPQWTPNGGCNLIIKGYSKTTYLDTAPRFRCFGGDTLNNIVSAVIQPYQSHFQSVSIANNSKKIEWHVQKNVSDHSLLTELADFNEEEFYFDGTTLHFANITTASGNPTNLVKGQDLIDCSLSANVTPLGMKLAAPDFVEGKPQTVSADPLLANHFPLLNTAITASKNFPMPPIWLNHTVRGENYLKSLVRRLTSRQAHDILVVQARSLKPSLKIGNVVTLDLGDEMLSADIANRSFVIIQIDHNITSNGLYQNAFTAVPVDHPYNLRMGVESPPMLPFAAIVRDNDDPKKMGRVKVEFIGDPNKKLSPWIRTLSPSTNLWCIPKKEEYVMIYHEGVLEESAFVLGAFRHKYNDAGVWTPQEVALTNGEAAIYLDQSGSIWMEAKKKIIGLAKVAWIWEATKGYLNCKKENAQKVK